MKKEDIINIIANTLVTRVFEVAYATKEDVDKRTSIIYLHPWDKPTRPLNGEDVDHIVNYYLGTQCTSIIEMMDDKIKVSITADDWNLVHPQLLEYDEFANEIITSLESKEFVISVSVDASTRTNKRQAFDFMASARNFSLTHNKYVNINRDDIEACVDINVTISKDIAANISYDINESITSIIDYNGFIILDSIRVNKDNIYMEFTLLM